MASDIDFDERYKTGNTPWEIHRPDQSLMEFIKEHHQMFLYEQGYAANRKRRKTRPTKGSVERRLKAKKVRGEVKARREKPRTD